MMRPELRIRPVGRQAVLRLPLGEGSPTLVDGFGGWETLERPGRVGMTRFTSAPPLAQDVPILLDGLATGQSVEPQINRLVQLARPLPALGHPPVLWIGGPVHRASLRWVIDGLTFDQAIRRPDGETTRQPLVIRFRQYVEPDQTRVVGQRAPRPTATYRARRGDNWRNIAARAYGDASRWREIARMNGNTPRDPARPLKPGRSIRVG